MKRIIIRLLLGALCAPLITSTASASHFRYATINWNHTSVQGEIVFDLVAGFRRDGYSGSYSDGRPQIGDVINESIGATEFIFGDGNNTVTLNFVVTAFSPTENWIIGRALQPGTSNIGVHHIYSGAGPFTAGIDSCCRIFDLNNGPSDNYVVQTLVTPFGTNLPPVTTLVPIVTVGRSANASFVVPASDFENDRMRFRFATSTESGVVTGGPVPPGMTIDPNTGRITWNNIGLDAVNPWTTQVIIEDFDSHTNLIGRTPVDFFLRINTNLVNNPPMCTLSTNGPLNVPPGANITFTVTANDIDPGDVLTINTGGLPSGATMSPSLPVTGPNGVSSTFNWTPGTNQSGTYVIQYSVTDLPGAQSLCSMTINVLTNLPPNLMKNNLFVGTNVYVGSTIMYELTFDTFSSASAAQGLKLIDALPVEEDFVSATSNGAPSIYDPVARTVTWDFGTFPPLTQGPTNYVTVVVNANALGASNIVNHASLVSSNLGSVLVGDRRTNCPTCGTGIGVGSNAPPLLKFHPSLIVSNDHGLCSAVVNPTNADAGSFSPQGGPLTFTFTPPPPYPAGTNLVTFTATDTNGVSSSTNITIIVIDAEPPAMACAGDKQIEFGANWDFDSPSATENCGSASLTIVSTVTNLGCGCSYSASRIWQAMDAVGNIAYCTQTVAVVDTTGPAVTCPASQTLEFADEHGAQATFSASAIDTCSVVGLTVSPASGSVFPIGVTTVLATALDACSNNGSCTFTITVLGALGVKQDILNEMLAARTNLSGANNAYLQKFDLAINHLELSLNPSNWIDQTHLDLVGGNFALNEEKLTVGALDNMLNSKNGPLADSVLSDWIDRLIKCDRLLAVISIEDAAAAGLNTNKVAEDWSFIAKGDDENAAGRYENGIEHYRNAWRHALNLRLMFGISSDGSVQLRFVGNNSPSFVIEVSNDLIEWTPLTTCTADTLGNVQFTDRDADKEQARFYRVRQQ
jgi:hypothetical protein